MRRLLLIALLVPMFLASSAFAAEVHLSVAASMTDAFRELVTTYEKKVENVNLLANFASSGALAKQIDQHPEKIRLCRPLKNRNQSGLLMNNPD